MIDKNEGFIRRFVDCEWTVHILTILPLPSGKEKWKQFSVFRSLGELLRWADIPFFLSLSRYQCLAFLPCHSAIFGPLNELIENEASYKVIGIRIAADAVEDFNEIGDDFNTRER